MTTRINGLKMDVPKLSDEELTGVYQHQMDRVVSATGDLALLEVELDTRGLTYVPAEAGDGQLALEFEGGEL